MRVSLPDGGIKPSGAHVLFNLVIPLIGHELLKPLGKTGQLGGRKPGNHGFNFFHTHDGRLGPGRGAGKHRLCGD